MADVAERSGQIAPELPTKNLPGVEYRDLPEPASLRRYMGASVILAATAKGETADERNRFGRVFRSAFFKRKTWQSKRGIGREAH